MPESQLLLGIINDPPPFMFKNVDIRLFLELLKRQDVEPFVFYRISSHVPEIEKEAYETLKLKYFTNLCSNKIFWGEFLKISEAFKQNKIPLLPLKGIDVLARFYPCSDQRRLQDIDVLVNEGDLERAEHIFSSLGYQKTLEGLRQEYWQEHQCHIPFSKDSIKVDVHFGLDFKRKRRVLLPRLWDRTIAVTAGNAKVLLFSPEDALFSFALHWRRFGNVFSLKQVMDVARIIRESPEFDWSYILKECERGRMKATTYFILMQAHLFCGTKIPREVLEKLNIPFWQKALIKRSLLKHTFETDSPFKMLYLKVHFLLYDNILDAVLYLIHIPYEQFCKFYKLKPYTREADLRYRWRIPYMAFSLLRRKSRPPLSSRGS